MTFRGQNHWIFNTIGCEHWFECILHFLMNLDLNAACQFCLLWPNLALLSILSTKSYSNNKWKQNFFCQDSQSIIVLSSIFAHLKRIMWTTIMYHLGYLHEWPILNIVWYIPILIQPFYYMYLFLNFVTTIWQQKIWINLKLEKCS